MRRLAAIVYALAASACAEEDVVLRLALPQPPAGARTAFLAILPDTLWMIDLEAPEALPALSGDALDIQVTYYREAPSYFLVAPGPILPPDGPSYTLPSAEAWQARVEIEREAPGWTHLDQLPTELASWPIPAPTQPCPEFGVRTFVLSQDPGAAVVTPRGDVLISDRYGHFSLFEHDGLTPVPELDGRPSYTALFSPDGELWSFGANGSGARGRLDEPAIPLPPAPQFDSINVAEGESTPDGFTVHTLSDHGLVSSFDGSAWTSWFTTVGPSDGYGRDLAVVGPGELMTVTRLSPVVQRITRNRVVEERPRPGNSGGLSSILAVPNYGVVTAASDDGQLVHSATPGVWSPLEGVRTALAAYAMGRDGDRIYAAGTRGVLIEVTLAAQLRVCTIGPLVSGSIEDVVTVRPGVLVLLASADGETPAGLAWIERQ